MSYQLKRRDPFAAIGIDLEGIQRRPGGGERATQQQLAYFKKAGLPTDAIAGLSSYQAEALREELLERKAVGLCTPKQAKALAAAGIDPEHLYYDEAKELLKELKARARG